MKEGELYCGGTVRELKREEGKATVRKMQVEGKDSEEKSEG